MLVFADNDAFKKALISLDKADKVALTQWETANSFRSSRSANNAVDEQLKASTTEDQATQAEQKKDALTKVDDPSFAALLNQDGYIQVGKTVYRITADNKVSQTDEANIGLLANPAANASLVKTQDVEIKTVSKITPVIAGSNKNAREYTQEYGPAIGRRWVWGYKQLNYAVYGTALVLTQGEYRHIWRFRSPEWLISDEASVAVNLNSARIYYWISGQETWFDRGPESNSGMGSTFIRLGYAGGLGAIVTVASCSATHSLSWSTYNLFQSY